MTSLNTDPKELNTFDNAAQDWWNPAGAFKTLHDINPLRLQFITEATVLAGKNVLDVGCGGGILAEALARQNARVTGIDMSAKSLSIARNHAALENLTIDYLQTTVEEFAQSHPGEFDVITCLELLEHVPDPVSVVQACAQLVKPGGELFFSTLNRNLKSYLLAIVGAEYVLKLLPKGLHAYEKFIRPSELASWLRACDLELLQLAGIAYNPISRHYQLSTKTDVNYLVHCRA
jgi:2-polyprenyl-6-hydroxyphenyl methylase / 3-demethylubiquinone-9 3-methyltransferase